MPRARPGTPGRDPLRARARTGGAASLLALGLAVGSAGAAETEWWIADSPADHVKSELHGVVVRPDGVIELGPAAASSPAESLGVIWAVLPLRDGTVAIAGERGRIDRWTEAGGIRPWVRLPVGQVLSLAADGNGLLAGTGPEGAIYRIGARGDTTLLTRTGERYVWGLVPGARGAWYAATGTRGRLYRITGRETHVLFDSDESNLVSLIADGEAGVYAGGDSHGKVFRVRADGSVRTLFDAAEDEVRGLALDPDGVLYAGAITGTAVTEGEDGERPAPTQHPVSGGRAVVYRIVPDSAAAALWTSPQPSLFALAATPQGILVATGNRAAVYRLDALGRGTAVLLLPQGQATALAIAPDGRVLAASSNPGALWGLGPGRAARGELLSGALDARRVARFGRILWRGSAGGGRIELHIRSGNTDPPDTTWSAWQGGIADGEGLRIASPPARYLQWKLALAGGEPQVSSVEAAWREINLAPRIEDVVVAPQGQGFREGELQPRSEPITQALPGGQRVEYSLPPATTPRGLRELPAWAKGLRTVQWRGSDPNGDPLRYLLEARSEDGGAWMRIAEDLETSTTTWETNALPDGRYRLRVTASDAVGNPLGEERTAQALSEPFTIDNTAPVVTALAARAEGGVVVLEGRAEDAASRLSRIEASVDDQEWRTVTPEAGLTDERALSFRARTPGLAAGEHVVSVRAVDLAGNATTRATRVTVPRAR